MNKTVVPIAECCVDIRNTCISTSCSVISECEVKYLSVNTRLRGKSSTSKVYESQLRVKGEYGAQWKGSGKRAHTCICV